MLFVGQEIADYQTTDNKLILIPQIGLVNRMKINPFNKRSFVFSKECESRSYPNNSFISQLREWRIYSYCVHSDSMFRRSLWTGEIK